MSETTNKFVQANLLELNKTEDIKQRESLEEFVETAQIDCNTQITLLETSELPKLQQQLKKAQLQQAKAEKAYAKARLTAASSFDSYVVNRERALDAVDSAKETVKSVQSQIDDTNTKLATFKEILADLS